jgi:phenylalanyl-tRNA synthetase beta chain
MLIPLSWLKDFVEIKLPLKDLMWRLTEAGLTCESYEKAGDDTILDVEVTANRPDWMSIIGVAREVAAIQGIDLKKQTEFTLPKKSANFPIDLIPDFELFERWTGIVIKGVEIVPSPDWLADRIKLMGHSPINNVIDTTNYVMYELGIPMHAFDYDEIAGQIMTPKLSKGGEEFTSVDNLDYKLPKDAIIINDAERLIDLAGIKGGLNSGIKNSTKNIFLHVTINNPVLVRRASQALGLRSEASSIYERGPDRGGAVNSIKRAVQLILDSAGGEVASDLVDLKEKEFRSWNLDVSFEKIEKVLGIKIPDTQIVKILDRIGLSPKRSKEGVSCLIPTYRADIKIEEDLVEEVARIYGYNKFPKTLPKGQVSATKIPYYFDDGFILKLKSLMVASGFNEVFTLSLISGGVLDLFEIDKKACVKITNPISLEYEYMRPTLIPSLINGGKLFEISKIYPSENYNLGAVVNGGSFRKFKGVIDLILERLNISAYKIEFESNSPYLHPSKSGTILLGKDTLGIFGELSPKVTSSLELKDKVFTFEFDVAALQKHVKQPIFKTIPENPPQVEDITFTFPEKTRVGEAVERIWNLDSRISNVELEDIYGDAYTFRIWYQDPKKTLTNEEVEKIRKEIILSVKTKFGGQVKN